MVIVGVGFVIVIGGLMLLEHCICLVIVIGHRLQPSSWLSTFHTITIASRPEISSAIGPLLTVAVVWLADAHSSRHNSIRSFQTLKLVSSLHLGFCIYLILFIVSLSVPRSVRGAGIESRNRLYRKVSNLYRSGNVSWGLCRSDKRCGDGLEL